MNDSERFRLLYGPYVPPKCRLGDKLACEHRGREVKMRALTDAPIQWPSAVASGSMSPILCGDLIRAVRLESEIAVAHHWGVSPQTVYKWRRALGVPEMNEGSSRLYSAYVPEKFTPEVRAMGKEAMKSPEVGAKIRAALAGRPLHPNMIAGRQQAIHQPKSDGWKRKMSERMREHWFNSEQHGRPPCHRWTKEEVDLLGTDTDPAVARVLGLPTPIVHGKRRRLGIPRLVQRWTEPEIDLLGTNTDREVARMLGKSIGAVRMKRGLFCKACG
jgi:hypothetical protein